MLDKVVARIEELGKALENSAANHNALLGAMQEAKNLYQMLMTGEKVVEELAPIAEEVVSDIEAVV